MGGYLSSVPHTLCACLQCRDYRSCSHTQVDFIPPSLGTSTSLVKSVWIRHGFTCPSIYPVSAGGLAVSTELSQLVSQLAWVGGSIQVASWLQHRLIPLA